MISLVDGDVVRRSVYALFYGVFSEWVEEINDYLFYGCIRLRKVEIPNSVLTIGEYSFCNCEQLGPLTIGNKVHTIGSNAFENCKQYLTSVTIPSSVTD